MAFVMVRQASDGPTEERNQKDNEAGEWSVGECGECESGRRFRGRGGNIWETGSDGCGEEPGE